MQRLTLSSPLQKVLKTTKKYFDTLEKMGITTVENFLEYFPRDYEDRTTITEMADLRADKKNILIGELSNVRREQTMRKNFSLVKAIFTEEKTKSQIECVWFKQPGLEKRLPQHIRVMIVGKAKLGFGKISLQSPAVENFSGELHGNISAVYSEHGFISNTWFARKFQESIIPLLEEKKISIPEILPEKISTEKKLFSRRENFLLMHAPQSQEQLQTAKDAFALEELFILQLASLRKKEKFQELGEGRAPKIFLDPELIKNFFATLPFTPTNAQKISIFEILKDMEKDIPMQRLLEGDVGAGKTLVALTACIAVMKQGLQCAILAPTEILASQHFSGIGNDLERARDDGFFEDSKFYAQHKITSPCEGGLRGLEGKNFFLTPKFQNWQKKCIPYNKDLKIFSQENRKNMPEPEKKLWRDILQNEQFQGLKFTRQKPLLDFIVDFYCASLRLVIEIDGDSHCSQEKYDKKRTKELKKYGISVIRYTNDEVMHNIEGVYQDLENKIKYLQSCGANPPSPPSQGGNKSQRLFAEEKDSPRIAFLSGSVKGKKREKILYDLKAGKIDLLIGTHAILEDPVLFKNLGFVVVDEQHRFGVVQREKLLQKGHPHCLQMSATPIPRTLAIVAFGDQDISVLNELPPGRQGIETKVVPVHQRRDIELFIDDQITKGRQAFVICPLVEESEHFDELKSATEEFQRLEEHIFPHRTIALLHGRMKPGEKDQVMNDFKDKKYDILVSTSVVEVGVDVPNATIMLIEGAERFGLSQLHQFRGRVGRGDKKSYCFLFSTKPNANTRLQAMEKTQNGFELAEVDMNLRGPGEVFGLRQSGVPELKMANLMDGRLVVEARNSAEKFLAEERIENFPSLLAVVEKKEKFLLRQ